MSQYQRLFSGLELDAVVTQKVEVKINVYDTASISYISSSKYWMEVIDKNGFVLCYLQPNSQGDVNFPQPVDEYLIIRRNVTLPSQDIGLTEFQFLIRFNSIQSSSATITTNTQSTGDIIIIGNTPHVIVDSGSIAINNFPATQPISGNVGLLAGVNNIGDVDVLTLPDVTLNGFTYRNFIAAGSTNALKAGVGVLHSVCINTPLAASSVQVYDSLTAAGTPIAKVDGVTKGTMLFDCNFLTGLSITIVGAIDVTLNFR